MPPSKSGPAAAFLRAHTQHLHAAVEATQPVSRLMAGPLDRAAYADILARFLVAQRGEEAAVRAALAPSDPALAALDGVRRLTADLAALADVAPPEPAAWGEGGVSGDRGSAAVPADEAAALGRLWCLWGAHRGGPSVVAALDRHLPGAPSHYFRATERDRVRHAALVERIAALGPEACLPGARAAFDGFYRVLSAASAGESARDGDPIGGGLY